MNNYSYKLFPIYLIIFGYAIIGLSLVIFISGINYTNPEELPESIGGLSGFLIIGLILVTFKTSIAINKQSGILFKKYKVFGLSLGTDKIKIPKNCNEIVIIGKTKTGKGYIRAAVGFSYKIKSYGVFFNVNGGIIRILNTDLKRAVKISEFIKENLYFNYRIKNNIQ